MSQLDIAIISIYQYIAVKNSKLGKSNKLLELRMYCYLLAIICELKIIYFAYSVNTV